MDLAKTESTALVKSSFTRFYGYVIHVSREKLDEYRESNNIDPSDFIELMISLDDEARTIKMSYAEFKKKLFPPVMKI